LPLRQGNGVNKSNCGYFECLWKAYPSATTGGGIFSDTEEYEQDENKCDNEIKYVI